MAYFNGMDQNEVEKNMIILCYDMRGRLMQLTIEIEKIVEYYIASKFIKEEDKITELIITIISPHIIFSKKIEIFCYLISAYDKWFIDKHTGINAALNTIKEERNRFAHWSLDFSPNA